MSIKEQSHTLREWQEILANNPELAAEFDSMTPPSPIRGSIQPASDGMEEEIVNYYGNIPDDKDKIESARHFAEWQKGNIKNLLKSWAENELDEHPNKNDDFRLAIYSLMDKLNDL